MVADCGLVWLRFGGGSLVRLEADELAVVGQIPDDLMFGQEAECRLVAGVFEPVYQLGQAVTRAL